MILAAIQESEVRVDPLNLVERPTPIARRGEILIEVTVCGVCHTELDQITGRIAPRRLPVIPGHQVVGTVAALGAGVTRWQVGDRVAVGWIHSSSGSVEENLSPEFRATGCDVDGGYAEFMTVPQEYAYRVPNVLSDDDVAPLMCAGAIGYRALKLAQVGDGTRLGLTGFGASAHLMLSLVTHLWPKCKVFVFARSEAQRQFARQLGAVWVGDTSQAPPEPLDVVIDTTPAWYPVVEALARLRPGGRLVINAIRKDDTDRDALHKLSYEQHLWMEREIKTVANITRQDIAEYLPLAASIPLRPTVTSYPLSDANRALRELQAGDFRGAKVLHLKD